MPNHTGGRPALALRLAAGLLLGALPGAALAGPCSDDIAALARQLAGSPALGGAPTSGALAGAGPGAAPAPGSGGGAAGPDRTAGTSAAPRQGGTAGTREMNATVGNQVATSPEDVRRQQEGKPTLAAEAEAGQRARADRKQVEVTPGRPGATEGADVRLSQAKSDLETARALDQKADGGCREAVGRVRAAIDGR